ncbi:MAG: BrnT family toxin [Magnetococcales bacterium]|nr:BrnT family toxin [Magnetococcales bacterium]
MPITFDPAKNARNIAERGLDFHTAALLDWERAVVTPDRRRDYGEPRFLALGMVGDRLHALVFTPRGEAIRVISFRKANRREEKVYGQKTRSRDD